MQSCGASRGQTNTSHRIKVSNDGDDHGDDHGDGDGDNALHSIAKNSTKYKHIQSFFLNKGYDSLEDFLLFVLIVLCDISGISLDRREMRGKMIKNSPFIEEKVKFY